MGQVTKKKLNTYSHIENGQQACIILVLNDGETYSDLEGCTLQILAEEEADKLMNGANLKDIPTLETVPIDHLIHQVQNQTKAEDDDGKDEGEE
ncbi:MAG: hypothetical protein GOVbin2833_20 [Prokaryotic dsDNA virus sp.]|nr:MAG: hypothetical protein GOVbin2833_20 [Prokaryotic dsDNA virus sp.]|tara:strand:- start:30 stop:311 length:282 start_codon:yes stop_codon:yes gene_type:complete